LVAIETNPFRGAKNVDKVLSKKRGDIMDVLQNIAVVLLLVGFWFALQKWILPKLGVPT